MRTRKLGGAASALGLAAVAGLLLPVGSAAPSVATARPVASIEQLIDGSGPDLAFMPALAAVSCPIERGPVKEGADAQRSRVSTSVIRTSIASLRSRARPSSYPRNSRVTTTELHTYQVTAYLTRFKQEADGDIHLVLADSAGRTMIAEIPFGSCVPAVSRWRTAIASARATFARTYAVTTSWHRVHRLVDVRGLGFMDPLHGQTGVAPNGVELHPVIYVHVH